MHFFPIFNKKLLKFPIPWVWVMFPKSWKKNPVIFINIIIIIITFAYISFHLMQDYFAEHYLYFGKKTV
jgi:hypothetical protein